MTRLKVSSDMPWTIGRALGIMELHRVFLVVDDTASEQFRRWIEALEDACGSLGHFDSVSWSPQSHKKHFAQNARAFELLSEAAGAPLELDVALTEAARAAASDYLKHTLLVFRLLDVPDDDGIPLVP